MYPEIQIMKVTAMQRFGKSISVARTAGMKALRYEGAGLRARGEATLAVHY